MEDRNIDQALAKLQGLNLKEYPVEYINELFLELGTFGTIITSLHPGKIIMRARPLKDGEILVKISDLSYKPQHLNKTYQRASTPDNTMFYGCTISDKPEDEGKMNNRAIGAFEAVPWLRDNESKGVLKIGFGKWIVKETLNLVSIVFDNSFYNATSYTKELVDGFNTFIEEHLDLKDNTLKGKHAA